MSTRKSLILGAFVSLVVAGSAAIPAAAQPQWWGPPGVTPQTEEAAHPRIVVAIHTLNGVLRDLQAAPDSFGGNKAQAMEDIRRSIHSLKRALYYRIRMDDATIDRMLMD